MERWIAFHREEHLSFGDAQAPPGPLGNSMIALQRVRQRGRIERAGSPSHLETSWQLGAVAEGAIQRCADPRRTTLGGLHPGTLLPGWRVANVLRVMAGQVCDPSVVVLPERL